MSRHEDQRVYVTDSYAGIWTKHLKAKTELHQTVITRCIKSLEQKGLIKAVDSVEVGVHLVPEFDDQ